MLKIEDMVQREVICSLSALVSTLAAGIDTVNCHQVHAARPLADLCEQAFELASPVPDYEEAALQEGWSKVNDLGWYINRKDGRGRQCKSWEDLCTTEQYSGDNEIEPYYWEVYEHWSVSQWLAEKLIAQGEKVDTDFGGLNVWARTTTGQTISMDGVVQIIYKQLMDPVG